MPRSPSAFSGRYAPVAARRRPVPSTKPSAALRPCAPGRFPSEAWDPDTPALQATGGALTSGTDCVCASGIDIVASTNSRSTSSRTKNRSSSARACALTNTAYRAASSSVRHSTTTTPSEDRQTDPRRLQRPIVPGQSTKSPADGIARDSAERFLNPATESGQLVGQARSGRGVRWASGGSSWGNREVQQAPLAASLFNQPHLEAILSDNHHLLGPSKPEPPHPASLPQADHSSQMCAMATSS